jgi:DNA-binding SARP family transcriptional activator
LTNLRSLLAPLTIPGGPAEPLLSITGQSVQLHPDPERLWVDIHAFDSLLAAADRQRSSAMEKIDLGDPLEEAAALYQGPFLAGLSLTDSREFEEWLMLHREQRHQAMMLALERLGRRHLTEGRTELVQRYARRQLALEPWSESGHQALMLALALAGQRGAALQQYEACRKVLLEELGVEPSAATEVLARQIREGVPHPAMVASSLPPAPFVARERELARLEQSLARALAGQGRVVLVAGEAGTGKTALLEHSGDPPLAGRGRWTVWRLCRSGRSLPSLPRDPAYADRRYGGGVARRHGRPRAHPTADDPLSAGCKGPAGRGP